MASGMSPVSFGSCSGNSFDLHAGQQSAASLIARGTTEDVVNHRRVNFLGFLGQAFQGFPPGASFSSWIGKVLGEMVLDEFEKGSL
jgi:hypothetical protein